MDANECRREIARKQIELMAVTQRWLQYRDHFRDERDKMVVQAIDLGVPKKELAEIIGVSPQWLNRLQRGEAYRRATD